MVSFLTDLAKTYVEKLIHGAIVESRYLFCFTCIAKEFEEEKTSLEAERKTLEQRANVARGRDKDILANVRFWEEEADKLIQVDTKTKQTCFFGFCPDCIWRYKRGKELAYKTEEIKRLTQKGESHENIELPRRLPDVERYSSESYISFKSRESKYKELLDALKDDYTYITGLQGMGGTGKTTLAKKVGKELKESEQFTHVIDTTVSFTPDIKKIQDDIAGPLGLKWEDCNDSDRPKKLWSRLTNGEKILLIMDDVWDQKPTLDFDVIGIPKRDNHRGCRVLITTRSKQIFNKMDCDKKIELELLSEEDAWTMFKRYAGISDSTSKNLINKGRKIAMECKGLPVAVAVIASSLKGQQDRQHEWDVTLKSLKKHESMHGVDDDLVGIYKCLKFSYDYMKDEKAKGLFLLSSVFPEDKEISIEILTRLGIGIGLFGEDYGSYDDARNEVVVAKNKLLDSCLFMEADEGHVKMHDLVREVAQWIANKEIQCVNLFEKVQNSLLQRERNIKYLYCEGKEVDLFSCKFDGSKLETLIVNVNRDEERKFMEVQNSFFESIVKLRVLYFFYDEAQPLSLPYSIKSLTNIRSILVHRVDLGDISVLGSLPSLETLDLIACTINELPHKLTILRKFKLLNFKHCTVRNNNPFEVIEKCSSLEELYFINSFNEFCQDITLPKLQRYHICKGWATMNNSLSKYVAFDSANLFSKETFKYFMQTAEALQLNGIYGEWRNLMPEIVPIDIGMNDLVELHLSSISQLHCLVDTVYSQVPNVFCKLVVLELEEMENLEELFRGSISFDSLKNLEKLSINWCEKIQRLFNCKLNLCNLKTVKLMNCPLVSLFSLSTCQSLVMLEKLEIFNCEGLKSILIDERSEEELREEINDGDSGIKIHGSMFLKLKILDIKECHQLESILPLLSSQVLEVINIHRCDELKYIFEQHVDLGSLNEIYLCQLPNLVDIFPNNSHSMSSVVEEPSIISNDVKCSMFSWTCICCHGNNYRHKLESTPTTKIPMISEDPLQDYSKASVSNSHLLQFAPCTHIMYIKRLTLSKFLKIKSVFILSVAQRMLVETLEIMDCDELKHITVDTGDHHNGGNNWGNVFPKLKNLCVYNCKKLEYIFGDYVDDYQNNTENHIHLPALQLISLQYLPNLVSMCPKQYRTTFPSLNELNLKGCSQIDIKSIVEFISQRSDSRSLDSTIMKELSGSEKHFITLKDLKVDNSKAENILCVNKIDGQQMNLELEWIKLHDMHDMRCLFVGPNNSFALQNLTKIELVRCEMLEIVFSTSILRCLSQLLHIRIKKCKELKHIITDENMSKSLSLGTCFPKLKSLGIENCYKLEYVFPISICKELPELEILMITEANEMKEIFKSEGEQKVKIPKLNILVLVNLPNLFHTQGIKIQAIKNCFVHNCQKIHLASALIHGDIQSYDIDYEMRLSIKSLLEHVQEESKGDDIENENSEIETSEDDVVFGVEATLEHKSTSSEVTLEHKSTSSGDDIENENSEIETSEDDDVFEVEGTLGHKSTSSEEWLNEESTSQQCLMINQQEPSHGNNCLKEKDEQSIEESYMSENIVAATISTFSEIRNEPPKRKGVEKETTLTNDRILTPSTHLELVSFAQEQDVDIKENLDTTKTNDDQVSQNDDVVIKVSSIIEEQFPKDDEFRVSKSKPSPSNNIPLPHAFQTLSLPYKGNPSIVTWELEQLLSKNYLDYKNMSLLTDFLVKNPLILLRDTKLSNKYKGHAYNCLAELLKFLQTHSVLDVLGSNHSEFVELLQDVRSFAFDKDWLDGVEKRALFPDLQFSQDALQKLVDSKKQVIKDVEVIQLKIDILTQNVEDLKHQLISSEAVLESLIQQETQVLHSKATLSVPLGY